MLTLFIVFAVVKSSLGQLTSLTLIDARYEYHPYLIKEGNFDLHDMQNVNVAKLGLLGINYKIGKQKRVTLDWKVANFVFSSYKKERFGFSFLDFAIRFGKGRFQPGIYCDLLEVITYKIYNPDLETKTVIHNSIAGGFNLYVTDASAITFCIGLTKERNSYATPFISPYVGFGFRVEFADVEKRMYTPMN